MPVLLKVTAAVFVLVLMATIIRELRPDFPVHSSRATELRDCAGIDLYTPVDRPRPRRVALYLHGGSWVGGDRRSDPLFPKFAQALLGSGIAVASADYRFGTWPIQLEDARCAVAVLRERFSEVVAWGGSAGGHIVAMLAVQDRRLTAAVSLAGPVDLTDPAWMPSYAGEVFPDRRIASPVAWLDPTDPPVLVILGDQDEYVPAAQVVGSGFRSIIVRGGRHDFSAPTMSPSIGELISTTVAFLSQS